MHRTGGEDGAGDSLRALSATLQSLRGGDSGAAPHLACEPAAPGQAAAQESESGSDSEPEGAGPASPAVAACGGAPLSDTLEEITRSFPFLSSSLWGGADFSSWSCASAREETERRPAEAAAAADGVLASVSLGEPAPADPPAQSSQSPLLDAAMCLLRPTCPTDGDAGPYLGDAWEEDEESDAGVVLTESEPSLLAPLRQVEERAEVAATSAIRARASMPEASRAGYDARFAEVRAALAGGEAEEAQAGGEPEEVSGWSPSGWVTGVPAAHGSTSLASLVSEGRHHAAAIHHAASRALAAELVACDPGGTCTSPLHRAEDSRRWRGCESIASAAMERAGRGASRRLRSAGERSLVQLAALAASLEKGQPCAQDAVPGFAAWPAGGAERARLVSVFAQEAATDTRLLCAAFATAIDRTLALVVEAGLTQPSVRLQLRAEALKAQINAGCQLLARLRARMLTAFVYLVVRESEADS